MGKSAGNAISIDRLIGFAGVDSARYFLLRATPFGDDGDFAGQALIERNNNELANKLGNLVSRLSTLAEQNGLKKSAVPSVLDSKKLIKKVREEFEELAFDKVLNEIFGFIDSINAFCRIRSLGKRKIQKCFYQAASALKNATILLSPFMPETAGKIAQTFGLVSMTALKVPLKITKIKKSSILFKRLKE